MSRLPGKETTEGHEKSLVDINNTQKDCHPFTLTVFHLGHNNYVLIIRILNACSIIGLPIEGVKVLPHNEDAHIEGEQYKHHHK